MKSLIVGMGIGQLYKQVLTELGHEVITVDPDISRGADLPTVMSAILAHASFDTVHICTPNFTHEEIARQVALHTRIVFIEKPGLESTVAWFNLTQDYPGTRFIMVKNNMWRDNIDELRSHVNNSNNIKFKWINKNRIPGPGTWFTTKSLAYGGVSRDLLPHLLSLYIALDDNWTMTHVTGYESRQVHTLDTISDTEYGSVAKDGIYDVDDVCKIKFMSQHKTWKLEAIWASGKEDNRAIEFELKDGTVKRFELGLCPESAYLNMIKDVVANVDDDKFWEDQLTKDLWIHKRVETI